MSARDRLLTRGFREVLLPSGIRIRGVMPSLMDMVRRQMIPPDLMATLVAAEVSDREKKPLTPDQWQARVQNQLIEAAAFVKQIEDEDGTWETVTLTADDIGGPGMDARDRDALIGIVTLSTTPEVVTAESRLALGLATPAEVDAVREKEAGGTVAGWSEFRDDGGSDAARTDGGHVADDTVGPSRGVRQRRRARARSGAGGPAVAGEGGSTAD